MKRLLVVLATCLLTASPGLAQDWAKARVEKSSRHLEWVTVKHGNREVGCYVGYPEIATKATAVLVIHDIYGLSDWARLIADDLAAAGYIAIVPDLLWGTGAKGGGTSELASDKIGLTIRTLPADQITADLNAAAAYVAKLPAANGKVAVAGFCWGGSQSFRYATNNKDIKTAFVFYGDGPTDPAAIGRIACPVLGFYGGNDARINSTIPKSEELMKAAGKPYDIVIYEGAGHGFMKAGQAPPPAADAGAKAGEMYAANKKAREAGWQRWLAQLKTL
ncbi:MAG: dienelactone hydrolase family protein [Opitutus sp.]|nr:dienelactone hydrolase family protein [Opitutus sp.]